MATLPAGAALPPIEASTLSGETVALPRDAHGHRMLVVFGFAKAAAEVTQPWLDASRSAAVAKPEDADIECFDLRMLEEVPRFFRGMMERGMKSGYPADLQKRTQLVYTENDAWAKRLGVVDRKTAYVIGCDADGVVKASGSGAYQEPELNRILQAVGPKPPS